MARARRMGSSSSITRTLLTLPAPGLRPGRSGPARCARSRFPLLAYGRAARAPLAALAHASRSWPTAGPLGPRSLRSLTLPAPGLRPGRSGPARCARSRRLPRQPQRPLADDVALDLVGPRVDRVGPAEKEQPLQ